MGVPYDPRLMRLLADLLYLAAGVLYLPVAAYQAAVQKKNRTGWRQRFGDVPRFDPQKERIWIHAVSLGEINATPSLVRALEQKLPDVEIVFSTTTDTGFARGVQLYGEGRVFRFPLDFSAVISKALDRIRPSMIVLVELEVWYNLVHLAAKRHIPIVVVNGRLTERSANRLKLLGKPARSMFEKLYWVCAQDDTIAARFRSLGVADDRIEVTSSLKWDTAEIRNEVEGAGELAESVGLDRDRPILVCGSTGNDEEGVLLKAYRSLCNELASGGADAPQLVVVPRKPERFDEVAKLIASAGFNCLRRSEFVDTSAATLPAEDAGAALTVILGDTMGEMKKWYALATLVFVGRSLVPMGGSDPIEVAALGKPIIAGPHMQNFALPMQALTSSGAAKTVQSASELPDLLQALLADPPALQSMGLAGQQSVRENQGATQRTATRIASLLERSL